MKLLAFAASNSSKSINKQLVGYATRLLEDELADTVTIETLDLNDYEMPIFSVDRQEADGIPAAATDFYQRIGQSDAILISFAEHNGSYTAAYKNIFDWTSRIDMRVYQDKPAVLLAASPGPGGGRNVLEAAVRSGQFFGYEVGGSLSIPSFNDNFDPTTGSLTNAELDGELRAALATLPFVGGSLDANRPAAVPTHPGAGSS